MDDAKNLAMRLLQKGYSPGSVRKAFVSRGYGASIVDEAMKELGLKEEKPLPEEGQKKPTPPPAAQVKKQAGRTSPGKEGGKYFFTGIEGFDQLLEKGMPRGISILVSGSAGTGKTLFCLHTMSSLLKEGKSCLYISLEESEERLRSHSRDLGLGADGAVIKRMDPFSISRGVEALLTRARGELLIDIQDAVGLIPRDTDFDFVFIDSLTAIAAAFSGKEEGYRIYIEQLFRYLEEKGVTAFMISETSDAPKKLSPTGVEEFLADGIIVMYNLRQKMSRERVLEILKMRGAKHKERLVPFEITNGGIAVHPEQEVFMEFEDAGK